MSASIIIPNVDRDERIGSVFNHLFKVIYQTENALEDFVVWNFENRNFFHPFFLAPLSIYKQRCDKKVICINRKCDINGYFELIHFDKPLLINEGVDLELVLSSYYNRSYLPICKFNLLQNNVDALQTIIQKIIEKQSQADSKITTPLSYMFGELICNMSQHSKAENGYIFSQYLKREQSINIILADDGITVYGSYVRTKKYLDKIFGNEAVALKLANEGYSTKDLPQSENRGFGISTSKNMLVKGLGGSFFMLSGNAFYRHDNMRDEYIRLPNAIKWPGTIILLRIPTKVSLAFNYLDYICK